MKFNHRTQADPLLSRIRLSFLYTQSVTLSHHWIIQCPTRLSVNLAVNLPQGDTGWSRDFPVTLLTRRSVVNEVARDIPLNGAIFYESVLRGQSISDRSAFLCLVPISHIVALVGDPTYLPCDISTTHEGDSVHLVLWYREDLGTSVYR